MGLGDFVKGDSDCSLQILGGVIWEKVDFILFCFKGGPGINEADIIECLAGRLRTDG